MCGLRILAVKNSKKAGALADGGDKGGGAVGEGDELVHRSINPSIKAASGASPPL